MTPHFDLVDVFGAADFCGNPLAVLTGADGLDTAAMLKLTRWFNLSETSFLLPPVDPNADYKVRIFTLERELPFAGHPTLGSCAAWLSAGGVPKHADYIVQECGAGLVRVKRDGERLAFSAPPVIRSGPLEPAKLAEICNILDISPAAIVDSQWVANGPTWAAVLLDSADAVRAVTPQRDLADMLNAGTADGYPNIDIGIVGLNQPGSDNAYELRALFTNQHGVLIEDPVTGSLNASVAEWMLRTGRVKAPYSAAQGSCIGRDGRIHISRGYDGVIWVSGRAKIVFSGKGSF